MAKRKPKRLPNGRIKENAARKGIEIGFVDVKPTQLLWQSNHLASQAREWGKQHHEITTMNYIHIINIHIKTSNNMVRTNGEPPTGPAPNTKAQ